MFKFILSKIVGTQNERELRRIKPVVDKINMFEAQLKELSDAQLRAKTDEFRDRINKKLTVNSSQLTEEEKIKLEKEALGEILPEAFAVAREAARRTINMRHFDAQLMGGLILHEGKIAEMATGEGKTLVATLPVYLNALTGKGVHVITVNDYLAKRDRHWMGPVYEFLGLKVGVIQYDMDISERQAAYAACVTYGTNNEFGFDYLRDNMVIRKQDRVQRNLNYAIVDEVDSILIDEARTPLIISGPAEESTELYYKIDRIIPELKQDIDYQVDEKSSSAALNEDGIKKCEEILGVKNLYEDFNIELVHHINQALRAHSLYKRDVDYMVKDDKVVIVDEFTGRLMPGRRWSDGLHQAIEAKEGVRIERENQTLATITFQNYFRMYKKLAGMTGTAATEVHEFNKIYKLDVVVIPPNKTLVRTNYPDVIYKTEREKFNAVVEEIAGLHKQGRPVLVGTISIEKSERLSQLLKRKGIPHQVLNAKYHELEAHIVAQAGRYGAVTIATNMAGRGTDILLGGNPGFLIGDWIRQKMAGKDIEPPREEELAQTEKIKLEVAKEHEKVVSLGGLHVLGTERHEARRIDNQLRGRSGRQGDPGSSRFYLSLEDDLMRIFGSERISVIMDKLGMEEGQDIQHPFVTKAIETAQKRVEAHNFEIRKQLLEYDNVMNRQREIIYQERKNVLESETLKEHILEMIEEIIETAVDVYLVQNKEKGEYDIQGLIEYVRTKFGIDIVSNQKPDNSNQSIDQIREEISEKIKTAYEEKELAVGFDAMRGLEKSVLLHIIDSKWKDHLYAMDNLREGIGLRAYGHKDPLVEYQHEGHTYFEDMINSIKEEAVEFMFKVHAVKEESRISVFGSTPQELVHQEMGQFNTPRTQPHQTPEVVPHHRSATKVGRNEPCPCGSGKKFKKCCGK